VLLTNYCLCVLVLCLSTQANNTHARVVKNSTALRCGIDPEKSAARILANPDGKNMGWREYRNVKDVSRTGARNWPVLLGLWTENARHGSNQAGRTPERILAAYTDYCFRQRWPTCGSQILAADGMGLGAIGKKGQVTNGQTDSADVRVL